MRQLAIRLAVTAALLFGNHALAVAHSTSGEISVSRSFSADTASPGDTIEVVITAEIGAIGSDPVRGFYLSDHIPVGLAPSAGVVTVDGSAVAAVLETGADGAVYSGCTTARWVLETPPAWSEGQPLAASSTLVVTYEVTVPLDAANGTRSFPGFTWVGMIAAQGASGDHFGYEDSPAVITVQGGVEPGDPDAGVVDPTGDGGSEPESGADGALTGGCSTSSGGPGPLLLLLAIALLLARRRR